MMILIYIVILLLNLILAFLHQDSKMLKLWTIVFIIICVAGSVGNADYFNYYNWYLGKWHPPTVEVGYIILSDFFSKIGISYEFFLALTEAFILLSGMAIVKSCKGDYHVFLALYMGYQLFLDYVQRRHAIATAVFLLAVFFLAKGKHIAYFILTIVSSLIHKSMLIFLPFVFLSPTSKFSKKTVRVFAVSILIGCMMIFVNGNEIPFLDLLEKITANYSSLAGKFQRYMTSKTRLGFIIPFFVHLMNVIVAYVSKTIVDSSLKTNDRTIKNFVTISYYIIVLTSFALPLVMINEEFIRYFRCCNVLIYVLVAIVFMIGKTHKQERIKLSKHLYADYVTYYLLVGLNVVSWLLVYTPNNVVSMFFKTNIWI